MRRSMRRNGLVTISLILGLLFSAGCGPMLPGSTSPPTQTFVNPVYEGADPFIYKHEDGLYYFCQSEGDRGIAVWKSDRLTDKGIKRLVWTAPDTGWNTSEIWAPELHYLEGRWYIYYAADSGENKDHRMGVLESVTDDPQGEYVDRGMLYTGDEIESGANNRWAIDGTPLRIGERLYFLWSGWEGTADEQWLYIAEMENPWTIKTNRVKIVENDDFVWERVSESASERGLNEAPQVLEEDGVIYVIYSVSGSWQPSYKLAQLSIPVGADPLDPSSWTKHDRPVFSGTGRVHGVGHASFTSSPDDSEDWIVYHTKIDTLPGWRRVVHMQPFEWADDGPDFGEPVPAGVPLPLPSGEPSLEQGGSFSDTFDEGRWDDWIFYGHNAMIDVRDAGLRLGGLQDRPAPNTFPSGEKALVRGLEWSDASVSARVNVVDGDGEAGLLIRASHPAVGYYAVRGYYAAIRPADDVVVLGIIDGTRWRELDRAAIRLEESAWYELRIRAEGDRLDVAVDGDVVASTRDRTYAVGMAGVRIADVQAAFDDVAIRPLDP